MCHSSGAVKLIQSLISICIWSYMATALLDCVGNEQQNLTCLQQPTRNQSFPDLLQLQKNLALKQCITRSNILICFLFDNTCCDDDRLYFSSVKVFMIQNTVYILCDMAWGPLAMRISAFLVVIDIYWACCLDLAKSCSACSQ